MKTMKVLIGVMFLLLVFGLATNATAQLIQNGSFELPVIPTNNLVREAPDSWTTNSANSGLVVNGTALTIVPQNGNQYYDLGNVPTQFLSQGITVTTGAYTLAWFDSSTSPTSTVNPYSVSFDGTSKTFTSTGFNNTWQSESLSSFNLVSGLYTLTFTSQGLGGSDTLLDNVSLTSTSPVSTPEPATMLLLGFGLVGLGGVRRFRK